MDFSMDIIRIFCFISLIGVVYGIKQTGEYYVDKEDSDCVVINGKRICNGGHKYYSDQKACSVVDEDGVCLNVPRVDDDCPSVNLVTREGWNATTSKTIEQMRTPVSIVFIHHTAQGYCHTKKECIEQVQYAQNYHMKYKGWDDISYNFLVGEDGSVYEGRGWDRIGAHTLGFNRISVSIAALGDFNHRAPNQKLLDAIDRIIACGVIMKKITPDYGLYGHRDARPMFDSPGHHLYDIIKGWKHYDKNGPSKNKTTH